MPRPATIMVAVTVAGGAALNLTVLGLAILHPFALNSDFMAFWSFPRFAAAHPVAQIYNAGALQPFQAALFPGFGSFYPYLYPPTLLLVIWWLKFCGFRAALVLWTAAGIAAFTVAALAFFKTHRLIVLLALLGSPAALLTGVTGETAFFTSALLLGGFAALPRRPILAGIAFGLLTLKPQLGVLIPFFLLARGDWAAIIAAGLTAFALILASCLVFPPLLWLTWAHTLPVYQSQYFSGAGLNLNIIVTPAANLRALGTPGTLAWLAQLGFSAACVACVMLAVRRAGYELAVAVLLTASFLAVPHAYAYDTITLTAAMALCLSARTPLWQILLGCCTYQAPLLLLTPARHYFLYALPETLLLGCIIALARHKRNGAIIDDEPEHLPATHR